MRPQKTGFFLLKWRILKKRFFDIIEQQADQIKEKPSKIALGCALGVGVNFFPTLGLGFLFAFILAALLRGNQVAATAVSLLTGPLIPLKYALNILVGGAIYARGAGAVSIVEVVKHQYAVIFSLNSFRAQLLNFLELFGATFIVGAALNALLWGTAFYFGVNVVLRKRLNRLPHS